MFLKTFNMKRGKSSKTDLEYVFFLNYLLEKMEKNLLKTTQSNRKRDNLGFACQLL